MIRRFFCGLIRLYQWAMSPYMAGHCRFAPSCSHYVIEAIMTYGVLHGGWLGAKRILRCRPGGGDGYDPVPNAPKE